MGLGKTCVAHLRRLLDQWASGAGWQGEAGSVSQGPAVKELLSLLRG